MNVFFQLKVLEFSKTSFCSSKKRLKPPNIRPHGKKNWFCRRSFRTCFYRRLFESNWNRGHFSKEHLPGYEFLRSFLKRYEPRVVCQRNTYLRWKLEKVLLKIILFCLRMNISQITMMKILERITNLEPTGPINSTSTRAVQCSQLLKLKLKPSSLLRFFWQPQWEQ